ncbi:unnamed protein product [Toxocara canis]|uniref:Uncharacterized protein n=1 Tax=Toxocara canis TaxID=6265 RepID=A0A3P7FBK0_TOXCA|nr:unnamed protein product [Toxocara canis]
MKVTGLFTWKATPKDGEGALSDGLQYFAWHKNGANLIMMVFRGAKGAYVVAEKKKFDEDARLKAGDYFDELFNAKITISGPGENAIISRYESDGCK